MPCLLAGYATQFWKRVDVGEVVLSACVFVFCVCVFLFSVVGVMVRVTTAAVMAIEGKSGSIRHLDKRNRTNDTVFNTTN